MSQLLVEETLGQKHRNYNEKVNKITLQVIPEIDFKEHDLDNLFKIDVASKNRNVEYIINALQCNDMLYVSRAITRSTWLITDQQYAEIINPKYLHDQLSINMMTKAFNKLLMHIRLKLKDEKRVEEFFDYYKERDLQTALKWLPNCSTIFTENIIQDYASHIPYHLLSRLCQKSFKCLDNYVHNNTSWKRAALKMTTVFLSNDIEKYLDIIEATAAKEVPTFGPKNTKLIMKKCSERVMRNLHIYVSYLDVPTFVKFIKRENVKDFITTNVTDISMKSLFEHGKIKHFIKRIPVERRLELIKEIATGNKQNHSYINDIVRYYTRDNSNNIYVFYEFTPFDFAFMVLTNIFRSEKSYAGKVSIFKVMLKCTRNNMKNIHTLLKYYRENHVNEPLEFEMQIVNHIILYADTHRFNRETWDYLNELFINLNLYSQGNREGEVWGFLQNMVSYLDDGYDDRKQSCISAIILYKLIHDENVPDVIEQKFLFNTFKSIQSKLTEDEKEKVFLYLYNYLMYKITSFEINDIMEFDKALDALTDVLNLLVDWNKDLQDFPIILDTVKEMVHLSMKYYWEKRVTVIYKVKKSWRKLLFTESIILNPTQEACINALKHGPELLETYKNKVECIWLNYCKPVDRFLKKVRIYFPESLANTFKDILINSILQKNVEKSTAVGLFSLLPEYEVLNLIHRHVPPTIKFDYIRYDGEKDDFRENIATSLHLIRPQPSLTVVLLYSEGLRLQYAVPSINSILCNLSVFQARENLNQLLNSSKSRLIQKLATRIAFTKLQLNDLKKLFSSIFETNENNRIRATIFEQTLNYICKEVKPSTTEEIWGLLSMRINKLSYAEKKSVYSKIRTFKQLPISGQVEFWKKSYKLLKSLPPKDYAKNLMRYLKQILPDVIEYLDDDFAAEIFLESFNENFIRKRYKYDNLVVLFLLSANEKEKLMARYNRIFVPILERSFQEWDKSYEGTNYVKENLNKVLSLLDERFEDVDLKPPILIIPIFTDILERLCKNLPLEKNYVFIMTRKMTLDFLKVIDRTLQTDIGLATVLWGDLEYTINNLWEYRYTYNSLYEEAIEQLGKLWLNYFREDVSIYFSSISILFAEAFKNIIYKFSFNSMTVLKILKPFLDTKDFIPGYLFVLESLRRYNYWICIKDEIDLKTELLKKISTHPSSEVKMYYYASIK